MRNLIVLFAIIILSACQKKETWICEDVKITTNYDYEPPKVVTDKSSFSKADLTEKEIRKFEADSYKFEEILNDTGKVRVTVEHKVTCQ